MKAIIACLALCTVSGNCLAETTLTLVSSWNREQNFTKLFLEYVDAVNAAGATMVFTGVRHFRH